MTVRVMLFGKLRERAQRLDPSGYTGIADTEVEEHTTILDILGRLGLQPEEVSHLFLNHDYSALNRRVRDGDRLSIFPKDMALLYKWYFHRKEE